MREAPGIERMKRQDIYTLRYLQIAKELDLERRTQEALLAMCPRDQNQRLFRIWIAKQCKVHGKLLALRASRSGMDLGHEFCTALRCKGEKLLTRLRVCVAK